MQEYLKLVRNVLENGKRRGDRTGVGTISLFGTQSRYNLQEGFPLVTTKDVNFGAIVAELMWFLSGSKTTEDLDSKIWDEWADPDTGNVGPCYGSQWRSWGDRGVDQISNLIKGLKENPEGRRHIVSAWNVGDLDDMALPPCHMMFQAYVREGKFLDMCMYQRSADLALGVPFNIASYALLMHMIANDVGLLPGELVHNIGDAHIYTNHIQGIKKQLLREPKELSRIILAKQKSTLEMEAYDIVLDNYTPHDRIRFQVAV